MEKKRVGCPFCGCAKQIGEDCPKCGRGGVILKVEDVVAGCRYHKPLSEHDSFDSAYEAACKLFDDGTWDDFLIDDGGHLTSLPGYRLVKETCPKCGKEARPFEMYGTRDYHAAHTSDRAATTSRSTTKTRERRYCGGKTQRRARRLKITSPARSSSRKRLCSPESSSA